MPGGERTSVQVIQAGPDRLGDFQPFLLWQLHHLPFDLCRSHAVSIEHWANWQSARSLIERAAGHGARFVATPENTNYLGPHDEKVRRAEPLDGETCGRFAERRHDDGGLTHTWGHAMIVDPWGIPVATASDGPGLALAEIDLDRVARVRQAIPVARHRRL